MKTLDKLISAATQSTLRDNHRIRLLVSRIVPATSLAHIQFCRLEGGRLRVTVDSAAWVARLRFSERQLIDELKRAKLDVHTISWHVAALEKPQSRSTHRQPNPLTRRSSECLKTLAESTRADEPDAGHEGATDPGGDKLRQELLKLAARLKE